MIIIFFEQNPAGNYNWSLLPCKNQYCCILSQIFLLKVYFVFNPYLRRR